jgi:hypothetical protein
MPVEFPLEARLMDILAANTTAALKSCKRCEMLVFSHVSIGATIPDLVIVRHPLRDTRRIRLSDFEAWIVAELWSRGALRESTITRRLYTRSERTHVALQKLERLGVIERTPRGAYTLRTTPSPKTEVVAIEAKLTRWRDAIEQARDYLRFSTASYVALPESVIERNADIIDSCAEASVGLLGVSAERVHAIAHPPRRNDPSKRDFVRVLSRTVGIALS